MKNKPKCDEVNAVQRTETKFNLREQNKNHRKKKTKHRRPTDIFLKALQSLLRMLERRNLDCMKFRLVDYSVEKSVG